MPVHVEDPSKSRECANRVVTLMEMRLKIKRLRTLIKTMMALKMMQVMAQMMEDAKDGVQT